MDRAVREDGIYQEGKDFVILKSKNHIYACIWCSIRANSVYFGGKTVLCATRYRAAYGGHSHYFTIKSDRYLKYASHRLAVMTVVFGNKCKSLILKDGNYDQFVVHFAR